MSIATSKIPDIIILDANLSNMDSFKMCRLFKQNLETTKIPVIFIIENNASDEIYNLSNNRKVIRKIIRKIKVY
jgi:PleD family two-component response regulator